MAKKFKQPLITSSSFYELPLDILKESELRRIRALIAELKLTGRLCSEVGEAIVAEFKFKGDFQSVCLQLQELKKKIQKEGFQEEDRNELFARHQYLIKHRKRVNSNPYNVEYKKLALSDIENAIRILDAKAASEKNLHEKKECLCFTNIIKS